VNQANEFIYDKAELQRLHPDHFDQLMERGWRMLGYCLLRHNTIEYNGQLQWTIPVRIRLQGYENSYSQRKLLRQHRKRFAVKVQEIRLSEEKELLFLSHCERFQHYGNYESLSNFVTDQSAYIPVPGFEIEVRDNGVLVACSYFHLGAQTMCGTYCFFNPDYRKHSLGNFTLLLEIQIAQRMGKQFYYPGYVHSEPSQFDYKLNFNQLEVRDWGSGGWVPVPRGQRSPSFL
jgi:leucyl-tRNA---protein transferase